MPALTAGNGSPVAATTDVVIDMPKPCFSRVQSASSMLSSLSTESIPGSLSTLSLSSDRSYEFVPIDCTPPVDSESLERGYASESQRHPAFEINNEVAAELDQQTSEPSDDVLLDLRQRLAAMLQDANTPTVRTETLERSEAVKTSIIREEAPNRKHVRIACAPRGRERTPVTDFQGARNKTVRQSQRLAPFECRGDDLVPIAFPNAPDFTKSETLGTSLLMRDGIAFIAMSLQLTSLT